MWRARGEDRDDRRDTAAELLDAASAAIESGRRDDAQPLLEGLLKVMRLPGVTRSDRPDPLLVTALTMLGALHLEAGRRADAKGYLVEAVGIASQPGFDRSAKEAALLRTRSQALLDACTPRGEPGVPVRERSPVSASSTGRPRRSRRSSRRWPAVLAFTAIVFFWMFATTSGQNLVAPAVVKLRFAMPALFGDGGYTFLASQDGQPVTFSSCRQLRVVINDDLRPKGAENLVEQAVAEVADDTGLEMYVAGSTDEPASLERPPVQARYGAGWAPILVVWTTPDVIPALRGSPIGRGGPQSVTDQATGRRYYATGQVFLDAPAITRLVREGRRSTVRAIVTHELGHVVGLGHVGSPFELMQKKVNGMRHFGPGDKKGLTRLGHGPCL